MNPQLLFITGWAHGPEAVQPMADRFLPDYAVKILTGTQVLRESTIPPADYIVTGSMGGLLAIELLPDSCKKLVLISSTAKFCADADYTCGTHQKILRRMVLQLQRNPAVVLEEFYKNVHYPHPALQTSPGSSQDDLVAGLEYLVRSDVRNKVPKIKIPVLLLHGAEDRIIPYTAAEWLHDHLPDSRLKIFNNGGHALPAHHFSNVMDELVRFIQPPN